MATKKPRESINDLRTALQEHDEHLLIVKEKSRMLISGVFNIYSDNKNQTRLIKDLKRTHYSNTKTEVIKNYFDNYNMDIIDINAVRNILEAEKHISEHSNKNGFFSKIGNVLFP